MGRGCSCYRHERYVEGILHWYGVGASMEIEVRAVLHVYSVMKAQLRISLSSLSNVSYAYPVRKHKSALLYSHIASLCI